MLNFSFDSFLASIPPFSFPTTVSNKAEPELPPARRSGPPLREPDPEDVPVPLRTGRRHRGAGDHGRKQIVVHISTATFVSFKD